MELLKFSTPTCGQCKVVEKKLREANVSFTEIDCSTTEGGLLAAHYDVMHVPTLILVDDEGDEVSRTCNVASILRNPHLFTDKTT